MRWSLGRWLGVLVGGASVAVALAACGKTKAVADAPAPPSAPSATAAPSASIIDVEPNAPTVTMPTADTTKLLAAGSNAFAFDLWAKTRKSAPGNFAFSPASISMAFAMTYGGAKGETAAQMKRVFHFPEEPAALMASWGGFGHALRDAEGPLVLRVANRLFGEITFPLRKPYRDQVRAAFGAALEPLDFKNAPEEARRHINVWVEDQTEKRIKDLLPEGALEPLARMVLVNAIYFLGNWEHPFEERFTHDEPFHRSASAPKPVRTMHQTAYVGAAQAAGVKVLELPYKGGSASLFVVLPDARDGLAAVESSLSNATFEGWRRAVKEQSVAVSLPRFELAASASLKLSSALTALGMPLAFDKLEADFTAIADPPDPAERLRIDAAFHKAFVKVDEKGTEAAAATAVVMGMLGGMPSKPLEFKADHPFLFFVVDKPSGLILFAGRVTDP